MSSADMRTQTPAATQTPTPPAATQTTPSSVSSIVAVYPDHASAEQAIRPKTPSANFRRTAST